jgi:hypothetical protein
MIGDGILAATMPTQHVALWYRGPAFWQAMLKPFMNRPTLTRVMGLAECGIGLWIASQQFKPAKAKGRRFAPEITPDATYVVR